MKFLKQRPSKEVMIDALFFVIFVVGIYLLVGNDLPNLSSIFSHQAVTPPPVQISAETDWKNINPWKPTAEDLTIWLTASSAIKSNKGAAISAWNNSGTAKLSFTPTSPNSLPWLKIDPTLHIPAVVFDHGNFLQSEIISGSQVTDDDGVTIVAVMRPAEGKGLSELFAWGNCTDNRLLLHTMSTSGGLNFHFGNPQQSKLDAGNIGDWLNEIHIISLVKDGANGFIDVDGMRVGESKMMNGKLRLDPGTPFMLANSSCGHFFSGEIFEFAVAKKMSKEHLYGFIKTLAAKYKKELP